jgi:hypothetical protein
VTPDDERLLDELRALGRAVDPVPAEVESFAKAALGWRRIDAELAELLSDSALDREPAGVRSSLARTRSMTFQATGLELDLDVQPRDAGFVLLGQLAPPAPAVVEVQRDDTTIAATATTDDLGRFRLELDEGGRVRLLVRREPPAPLVETSWLTL